MCLRTGQAQDKGRGSCGREFHLQPLQLIFMSLVPKSGTQGRRRNEDVCPSPPLIVLHPRRGSGSEGCQPGEGAASPRLRPRALKSPNGPAGKATPAERDRFQSLKWLFFPVIPKIRPLRHWLMNPTQAGLQPCNPGVATRLRPGHQTPFSRHAGPSAATHRCPGPLPQARCLVQGVLPPSAAGASSPARPGPAQAAAAGSVPGAPWGSQSPFPLEAGRP